MSSIKLIMSVKNGTIQKSSKLAKLYNKTADDVSIALRQTKSTLNDKDVLPSKINDDFLNTSYYKDDIPFYPIYSINDIPLSSSLKPDLHKKANTLTSNWIDTDLVTTKLIGTNRTVFLDSVLGNRCKANDLICHYTEKYGFRNAANIINNTKGFLDDIYIAESFALLKNGHPLEQVLKYMDEALLDSPIRYSKGLIKFVADNPEKKHLVIVKDRALHEIFDRIAAINFHIFENLCPDEKSLEKVIKACRCRNTDGIKLTDDRLSYLAVKFLEKHKEWSDIDNLIFKSLKFNRKKGGHESEIVDSALYNFVSSLVEEGCSSPEILRRLNKLGITK